MSKYILIEDGLNVPEKSVIYNPNDEFSKTKSFSFQIFLSTSSPILVQHTE